MEVFAGLVFLFFFLGYAIEALPKRKKITTIVIGIYLYGRIDN